MAKYLSRESARCWQRRFPRLAPLLVWSVLVVLVWAAIPARTARGESYDVPLEVQTTAERLHADTCGYWAALAFSTGFAVRQRQGSEPAWMAALELVGDTLDLRLLNPQGELRASKSMPVAQPCAEAIEILSILLAAHVPDFDLDKAGAAADDGDAEPASPDVPPPPDDPTPPAEVSESGEGVDAAAALVLELTLAAAVVLVTERPRGVASLGVRWHRSGLLFGVEVGGGYHQRGIGSGSLSVTELGPRLLLGLAPLDGDRLDLRLGATAGARVFRGTTKGLAETGSDDILAAELGAFAEAAWPLTASLSLTGGIAVRRLLPRPAFAVTGRGQIFRTPVASLELSLGLAWGPTL